MVGNEDEDDEEMRKQKEWREGEERERGRGESWRKGMMFKENVLLVWEFLSQNLKEKKTIFNSNFFFL